MSARAAAFFDVDGTIVEGDVVRYYARLSTYGMSSLRRALWMAGFVLQVPWYWALDKWSRRRFQRALYRNYARIAPQELERRAAAHFRDYLEPRIYPEALSRIRDHLGRAHLVVLVTGSLQPIVAPLAAHVGATELLAPRLQVEGGAFTGELAGEPLADVRKAQAVTDFVDGNGLDPALCHAYADRLDDAELLGRVGHAHVVNPGQKLERIARQRGWEILRWSRQ